MQRAKTRAEIANEFFVNKAEIQKLFGLSRSGADVVFKESRDETSWTLFGGAKVRLKNVCGYLNISESELRRKVSEKKPDMTLSGIER